jgi:hypothetical protein
MEDQLRWAEAVSYLSLGRIYQGVSCLCLQVKSLDMIKQGMLGKL